MSMYLRLLKEYGKAVADRYLALQQDCLHRQPQVKRSRKKYTYTTYVARHPDPQQQKAIERECRALLREYERRNKARNGGA